MRNEQSGGGGPLSASAVWLSLVALFSVLYVARPFVLPIVFAVLLSLLWRPPENMGGSAESRLSRTANTIGRTNGRATYRTENSATKLSHTADADKGPPPPLCSFLMPLTLSSAFHRWSRYRTEPMEPADPCHEHGTFFSIFMFVSCAVPVGAVTTSLGALIVVVGILLSAPIRGRIDRYCRLVAFHGGSARQRNGCRLNRRGRFLFASQPSNAPMTSEAKWLGVHFTLVLFMMVSFPASSCLFALANNIYLRSRTNSIYWTANSGNRFLLPAYP